MERLDSRIDASDATFKVNGDRMRALVADLAGRVDRVKEGGGAKYIERHRAQGKLTARERIDRLIDRGSPFLELSPLAATAMYDDEAPGAGIVTGVARVSGQEVL